jgi:hypothetical protein
LQPAGWLFGTCIKMFKRRDWAAANKKSGSDDDSDDSDSSSGSSSEEEVSKGTPIDRLP